MHKKLQYVVNFETKEQRRLLLYEFKIIRTNIQPEFVDKSAIISTHACARP